jgi:hypothetical protein
MTSRDELLRLIERLTSKLSRARSASAAATS